MIKLPLSDYVADYYRKEGIEFTFLQQAHLCWYYNDRHKGIEALKEILIVSDDEVLNAQIRERLEYEENGRGRMSFDETDSDRFECMFLNVKSPFEVGDIVTEPGIYDGKWVVKSGHDTFTKVYDRFLQGKLLTPPDVTDNVIRIEKIGGNPEVDYDHAPPFQMLKIGVYDEGGENDGAKREVN
jgi:hypothetical protein